MTSAPRRGEVAASLSWLTALLAVTVCGLLLLVVTACRPIIPLPLTEETEPRQLVDDHGDTPDTSALRLLTGALGGSGRLLSADGLIAGGTTLVRLKGEGVLTRVEVEGNGPIERLKLDTGRLRGALEGSHEQRFRWGRLTPTLEVAVRHDHGDGAQGAGLELSGELRYAYPEFGLTVAGHGSSSR